MWATNERKQTHMHKMTKELGVRGCLLANRIQHSATRGWSIVCIAMEFPAQVGGKPVHSRTLQHHNNINNNNKDDKDNKHTKQEEHKRKEPTVD